MVRRDLPFGVLLAMVTHAAGESFYKLASCVMTVPGPAMAMASGACSGPRSSVLEQQVSSLQVGGSIPSAGSTFDPSETVAVVLGARNEGRLAKLESSLLKDMVPHVAIRETEGDFAGQLMAVGIVPGDREFLSDYVNEFHMYREIG